MLRKGQAFSTDTGDYAIYLDTRIDGAKSVVPVNWQGP